MNVRNVSTKWKDDDTAYLSFDLAHGQTTMFFDIEGEILIEKTTDGTNVIREVGLWGRADGQDALIDVDTKLPDWLYQAAKTAADIAISKLL
jgi:hypothetical protein